MSVSLGHARLKVYSFNALENMLYITSGDLHTFKTEP